MKANLILVAIILVVLGAGAYLFIPSLSTYTPPITTGTSTTPGITIPGGQTTSPPVATSTQVKIALLDTTGTGTGKSRGCDTVTLVTRTTAATSSVLTAALQTLFAEPEGKQPSNAYNFIARTHKTLKFDHVTIQNGTASIYLSGSLSGLAGVCDDPRAQIQIEETALQFPTVTKVVLYLNGKQTTLTPSQKGE